MIVYDVYTDLDPDQLTQVAMETYRMWLEFALGRDSLIGKSLVSPTGRYAASLSWKRTGVAQVSVIADEKVAPEAVWIETGTAGADMKQMLYDRFKINEKTGLAYRVIPIRPDNDPTRLSFNPASIVGTSSGKGERLPAGQQKMWAVQRATVDPNSHFVTMRSDSVGWQIAPMPAYAPGAILKAMLENEYGTR